MKKEVSRQFDSVIFEGMTSISAVINGGKRKINKIMIDRNKANAKNKEIRYLQKMQESLKFEIVFTDNSAIDEIAVGNSHGGIIAECTERDIPHITEIAKGEKGFAVMIDGIEDPYNFGYAVRTIYAAGADFLILTPRNWMSAAGVVCRSSAGASELIPSYTAEPDEAIDYFRNQGYKIVAAGIRDSVSAFDADLTFPVFLIVGGEKRGISANVLCRADLTVRLDYGRVFNGSLSAASAASVLSYEILRQNRK